MACKRVDSVGAASYNRDIQEFEFRGIDYFGQRTIRWYWCYNCVVKSTDKSSIGPIVDTGSALHQRWRLARRASL
jgi:hypothetical protein